MNPAGDEPWINDEGKVPARLRDFCCTSAEGVSDIPGVVELESISNATNVEVCNPDQLKNRRCEADNFTMMSAVIKPASSFAIEGAARMSLDYYMCQFKRSNMKNETLPQYPKAIDEIRKSAAFDSGKRSWGSSGFLAIKISYVQLLNEKYGQIPIIVKYGGRSVSNHDTWHPPGCLQDKASLIASLAETGLTMQDEAG